ncbi:ER membrane protein complex subunit 9 isoform X2 [Chrysemys picta bellii]|uniref:ER membrane protein complex subunit 9 isoform X2 n=1 Tax=Chrysemys picta bellii TaxID=8478 RepID=UPI0032B2D399
MGAALGQSAKTAAAPCPCGEGALANQDPEKQSTHSRRDCNLALSVMLEVALNQVDLWASRSNLLVAGYYQANAGLDDMSPTPLALKMAGRLAELSEGAVLIMLDNRKLTQNPRVPPVVVLEQRDRHWLPKDKNLVMWHDWESSRHICKSLLEAKAHTQLVDFDTHLDDIRRDWTNQHLNTEIARLVSVANGSA